MKFISCISLLLPVLLLLGIVSPRSNKYSILASSDTSTPSSWTVLLPGGMPSLLDSLLGGTNTLACQITARLNSVTNPLDNNTEDTGVAFNTSLQTASVFPGSCVSDRSIDDEPFGWNKYRSELLPAATGVVVTGNLIKLYLFPRMGFVLVSKQPETITCTIPGNYVLVNGSALNASTNNTDVRFSFVVSPTASPASLATFSVVDIFVPRYVPTPVLSAPDQSQLHVSDIRSKGLSFCLVLTHGNWNWTTFVLSLPTSIIQCGYLYDEQIQNGTNVEKTMNPTLDLCSTFFNLNGFGSEMPNFMYDQQNVPNSIVFNYSFGTGWLNQSSFALPAPATKMLIRVTLPNNGAGFTYGSEDAVTQSSANTVFAVLPDPQSTSTTSNVITSTSTQTGTSQPITTTTVSSSTATTTTITTITTTSPPSTTTTTTKNPTSTTTAATPSSPPNSVNTSIFVRIATSSEIVVDLVAKIAQVANIDQRLLQLGGTYNESNMILVQVVILGSQSANIAEQILLWQASQRNRAGILASYSVLPDDATNTTTTASPSGNDVTGGNKKNLVLTVVVPVLVASMLLLVVVFVAAKLRGRSVRSLDRAEYVQMMRNTPVSSRADLQRGGFMNGISADHLGEEDEASRSALGSLQSLMTDPALLTAGSATAGSSRHLSATTTPGHPSGGGGGGGGGGSGNSSIAMGGSNGAAPAPSSTGGGSAGGGGGGTTSTNQPPRPPQTPAAATGPNNNNSGGMHTTVPEPTAGTSRCSAFGALKAVAIDKDVLIVDSKIANIQDAELAAAARHPYKHHTATVFAVAFSPDASTLASAGKDGVIAIWDLETSTVRSTLKGHTNTIFSLQYSPCGNMLASGSRDTFVLLWDITRNTRKAALKGHTSDVLSVAFSGDGKWFASGSHDQTILIWDMKLGTNKAVLKHHTSAVNFVTFSPESTLLASGSDDGSVVIFDLINNVKKQKLCGHNAEVNCITFFPNGTLLATAGDDKRIVLWDMKTFDPIRTLVGHQGPVLGLSFSPDQYLLASCSKDGSVILWDLVHDYRPLVCSKAAGHRDRVWTLSWSHDSNMLATCSGDHNVIIWDVVRGHRKELLAGAHASLISSASFLDLPDAPFRIILRSVDESKVACIWDAETGKRTTVEKVLEQERRARDEMLRKSREDQIRRGLEVDDLKNQIPNLLSRIEALEATTKQQQEQLEHERKLRQLEHDRHEEIVMLLLRTLEINTKDVPARVVLEQEPTGDQQPATKDQKQDGKRK